MFDALLGEDGDYSRLTEDERDIVEAIDAIEREDGSHIEIPRIAIGERLEVMRVFKSKYPDNKHLNENHSTLEDFHSDYHISKLRKGLENGLDLKSFTNGVGESLVIEEWNEYYRTYVREKAIKWLDKQK